MKLKSLIQNGQYLEVAEVELEFIPGVPQIHFLGLPDRIIKESFYRIKSALKSSGYKFPLTQQMIVNIKPSHLRKSSRGVELAVALGILLKTKQISEDQIHADWVMYGELGLDGSVYEPSDLSTQFINTERLQILTGWSKEPKQNHYRIQDIKTLDVSRSVQGEGSTFIRPQEGLERHYGENEAEFLFLSAATGFHGLLAGDAGAGKSTLAKSLLSFLSPPEDHDVARWRKDWRPLIAPHHTITAAAFLGGGAQLYVGEVERAHQGILMLDELLQFHPEIVETLRGPMVGEKLRLVRAAQDREIECHFQVVATTNLCPCGKWTPLKKDIACRFSRLRCMKYLERLSGPLVDRFGLMMFTTARVERTILGHSILERIERTRNLLKEFPLNEAEESTWVQSFYSSYSKRRTNYLERVAWIYSLERQIKDGRFGLQAVDFNKAENWCLRPFIQLERGMD